MDLRAQHRPAASCTPLAGIKPATRELNWQPSVHRTTPNPLSHAGRGHISALMPGPGCFDYYGLVI